jgi:hypothetical protein
LLTFSTSSCPLLLLLGSAAAAMSKVLWALNPSSTTPAILPFAFVFARPAVPQVLVAVMACERIGAISSTVFGGFASHELAVRLDDFKPKVILAGCVCGAGARLGRCGVPCG